MFIRLLSCTTFKFQQRAFGKTNPVKRSFQASWFTNRTPPVEIYRGVETVVHSFNSGGGRNTFEYG